MNLLKDVKAYYKVDDNIYTELTQEEFVDELDKLCLRLQDRIEEAIEYIEWQKENLQYKVLLDILKGDNNE